MTSSTVESLIARNEGFARDRHDPALRMMPSLRTTIVGCVDPRVDPVDVLGLRAGETAIIRNVGGRITPSTIDTLSMLREVTRAAGGDLAEGWNLVVLHHTDCGITRLARAPHQLAKYFGVAESELPSFCVHDPRLSVARDVETLRASDEISGELVVSGLVYDVKTGRVETVVAPARLRGARATSP